MHNSNLHFDFESVHVQVDLEMSSLCNKWELFF